MKDVLYIFKDLYPMVVVFARLGPAISMLPGLEHGILPGRIRLYVAFVLSFVLSLPLRPYIPIIPPTDLLFGVLILKEVSIGYFIGLLIRVLFYTLEMTGSILSFHMGLSSATAFNPTFGPQTTMISSFLAIAGTVLIFVTNMHIYIFDNLILTYETFPPGADLQTNSFVAAFVLFLQNSFLQAMILSLPMIVIILLFYLSVGLLSRFIPQVQIFFITLPAQVTIGIFVLGLIFSGLMAGFLSYFEESILVINQT